MAAGATAATASSSPPAKPVLSAETVQATAIGVAADAVEQVVRPDMGRAFTGGVATTVQTASEGTPIGQTLAPITNELLEAWKASGSAKSLEDWILGKTEELKR